MPQGFLSIVLHTHLPYVRHPEHEYSLEEKWFYEAMLECYLPLLKIMEKMNEDEVYFQLVSGNSEFPIKVYSPPVSVDSGQRVQVRATFFNHAVDRGFAEIHSEYTAVDGTVRRLNGSTVHDLTELDRWSPRAATSDEFQGGGSVRYVLETRFAGELLIRDCSMFLR